MLIVFLFLFAPFRADKTFILSGVELPSPAADPLERQHQLKLTVATILNKLDPALAAYTINYVRVVKSPKPSILEVECDTVERYFSSKYLLCYCIWLSRDIFTTSSIFSRSFQLQSYTFPVRHCHQNQDPDWRLQGCLHKQHQHPCNSCASGHHEGKFILNIKIQTVSHLDRIRHFLATLV